MLKKCKKCGRNKRSKSFSAGKAVCKPCHSIEQRKYYHKAHKAIFEKNLRVRWGQTVLEFQAIKDMSSGKCMLCGEGPTGNDNLVFDHDHKSGKPRGYIHRTCNLMLGYAKDNVSRLAAGILYLNRSLNVRPK